MKVLERDCVIVADRLPDQTLRIVLTHAGEMLHQHINRLLLALDRLAVLTLPQLRFLLDQLADFLGGRQRQRKACAHALQGRRHIKLLTDKHQGARSPGIFLRDLLDEAHVHRVFKIRLWIEQHVNTVLRSLVDVAQRIAKIIGLRNHIGTRETLEAVGHRPHEERPALEIRGPLQQPHHACLLAGLHLHQREMRLDDQRKIVEVIRHAPPRAAPRACRECRQNRRYSSPAHGRRDAPPARWPRRGG